MLGKLLRNNFFLVIRCTFVFAVVFIFVPFVVFIIFLFWTQFVLMRTTFISKDSSFISGFLGTSHKILRFLLSRASTGRFDYLLDITKTNSRVGKWLLAG